MQPTVNDSCFFATSVQRQTERVGLNCKIIIVTTAKPLEAISDSKPYLHPKKYLVTIAAFWAVFGGFGPLLFILFG